MIRREFLKGLILVPAAGIALINPANRVIFDFGRRGVYKPSRGVYYVKSGGTAFGGADVLMETFYPKGSRERPFKSLNEAVSLIGPGDTTINISHTHLEQHENRILVAEGSTMIFDNCKF